MIETTPTTTTSQPKPRIRHINGTRYLVESKTRPGIGHQVDTLRLRCGCEAGSYGRRCWHLVAALEYEAWRKRQQAQAKAAAHRAGEKGASAPVPPAPAPVPHAPVAGAWHDSPAYRGLADCFE